MPGHTPYTTTINGTQYTVTPKPTPQHPLKATVEWDTGYRSGLANFNSPALPNKYTTNPRYDALAEEAHAYLEWVQKKEQGLLNRYTRHGHIIIDTTPGANRYARFDDPNDATYECGQLNAQTGADSNNGRGLHWVEGAPRYIPVSAHLYDTTQYTWLHLDTPHAAQQAADFYNTNHHLWPSISSLSAAQDTADIHNKLKGRGAYHEWRDTP